jgi:hypothetical protein
MADAVITTTSLGSGGLKSLMTLLAGDFISALRNRGRVLTAVNTQAGSGAVAAFGDTARVVLAPDNLTTNVLTDGNTKVLDDTVGSSIDVVLNKHRVAAFGYTQIAEALDGRYTMPAEVQARIFAILNDVESDALAIAQTGFTTNTTGTYTSNLTEAVVVAGMTKLYDAGVPEGEPITGFLKQGSTSWGALVQLGAFREFNVIGQKSPIVSQDEGGSVSEAGYYWHGCNWKMSQGVHQSVSNVDNVMLHKDAIAVAMRPLPIPTAPGVEAANFRDEASTVEFQLLRQWNTAKLAEEIVCHVLYGVSAGKEQYGNLLKA